jgi:hypothetical protein
VIDALPLLTCASVSLLSRTQTCSHFLPQTLLYCTKTVIDRCITVANLRECVVQHKDAATAAAAAGDNAAAAAATTSGLTALKQYYSVGIVCVR